MLSWDEKGEVTHMDWWMKVYLGGLVLRAFLAHGILQNPSVEKATLDGQVLSCIVWPVLLLKSLLKSLVWRA